MSLSLRGVAFVTDKEGELACMPELGPYVGAALELELEFRFNVYNQTLTC